MDLIHALEKARTKDDLEALGIEHLGIDVDKRKTKEVLRAELIALADAQDGDTPPAHDTPEPAPAVTPSGYPGKLGRNTRTGRLMPWIPAMAGMSHMEEV